MIPVFDMSAIPVPHTSKIRGRWYMTEYERSVLIALANHIDAHTMVETGVNIGMVAFEILFNVPKMKRYVGIDVPKGYVPSLAVQMGEVPDDPGMLVKDNPKFHLVIRPRGSLDLKPENLPLCDIFLIDGDHGREAVLHDTALGIANVRRGGLIIWHDYLEGCRVDVQAVVEELAEKGRKIEYIPDTWFAVERVA